MVNLSDQYFGYHLRVHALLDTWFLVTEVPRQSQGQSILSTLSGKPRSPESQMMMVVVVVQRGVGSMRRLPTCRSVSPNRDNSASSHDWRSITSPPDRQIALSLLRLKWIRRRTLDRNRKKYHGSVRYQSPFHLVLVRSSAVQPSMDVAVFANGACLDNVLGPRAWDSHHPGRTPVSFCQAIDKQDKSIQTWVWSFA